MTTDEQTYLPPKHDWKTGDMITDLAWLKWYQNVGNLHKSIKFVNVTGDLDDISDGSTYGRVDITQIDANGIVILSQISGDLDDVSDGSTYSKVLTTDISAGHILLSETSGDLDDVTDGTNYGKVASTSISAGKIIINGFDQDAIDSYGPIVADPTFSLTASNSDDNFYNQDDAQVAWSATDGYGSTQPGLRITSSTGAHDCVFNDGGGAVKYIPASSNDRFLAQVVIRKTADFDGDVYLRMVEVDESKSAIVSTNTSILPSVGAAWETLTIQVQPSDTGCHFVYFLFRISDGSTAGYVRIDSVSILKESESNFRHASNVTKIDGGDIYTGTVTADSVATGTLTAAEIKAGTLTAAEIKGTGFGNLSISSGSINFTTTSGGITFEDGTDLILEGSDSDPGKVQFGGSSYDVDIGLNAAGTEFFIQPSVNDSTTLSIGDSFFGSGVAWDIILLNSASGIVLDVHYSATAYSKYNILHTATGSGYHRWFIKDGTDEVYIEYTSNPDFYFWPTTDSKIDLGAAGYCWKNVYADAGVTSCSDRKYKTAERPTPLGLDFINSLVPIEFEFSNKGDRPKNHAGKFHGLIGPEVEQALIDCGYQEHFAGIEIDTDEKGDDWYGLKYEQFIAPLIKGVQELSAKIDKIQGKE